jgi:hypothetical protein
MGRSSMKFRRACPSFSGLAFMRAPDPERPPRVPAFSAVVPGSTPQTTSAPPTTTGTTQTIARTKASALPARFAREPSLLRSWWASKKGSEFSCLASRPNVIERGG